MMGNVIRSSMVALAAVTLNVPAPAQAAAGMSAADAKKFFNDKGCNACHGLDEQRIGPAYHVIAQRYSAEYAESPAAWVDRVARKIRFGGAGSWGYVPMVSNPGVSEDEAEGVARWIMTLSNDPPKPAAN